MTITIDPAIVIAWHVAPHRAEMLWATCPHCDGTYGTTNPAAHASIEGATAAQCDEWHADRPGATLSALPYDPEDTNKFARRGIR